MKENRTEYVGISIAPYESGKFVDIGFDIKDLPKKISIVTNLEQEGGIEFVY